MCDPFLCAVLVYGWLWNATTVLNLLFNIRFDVLFTLTCDFVISFSHSGTPLLGTTIVVQFIACCQLQAHLRFFNHFSDCFFLQAFVMHELIVILYVIRIEFRPHKKTKKMLSTFLIFTNGFFVSIFNQRATGLSIVPSYRNRIEALSKRRKGKRIEWNSSYSSPCVLLTLVFTQNEWAFYSIHAWHNLLLTNGNTETDYRSDICEHA